MNKWLIVFAVVMISLVGAMGYLYITDDQTSVSTTSSIIPAGALETAGDSVEVIGDDFKIECDKTVYSGLSSFEAYCNITNTNDFKTINKDIYLLFSDGQVDVSDTFVWDSNAIVDTIKTCTKYIDKQTCFDPNATYKDGWCYSYRVCSDYETTYNTGKYIRVGKATNTYPLSTFFEPFETKSYKFIVQIPMGTEGKFDLLAGETTLDPWWQSTLFTHRVPIYHNASELNDTYAVNDTNGVGLNGDIVWARIWNESYVYSSLVGTTGNITIANLTAENCWENETSGSGNCVENVYGGLGANGYADASSYYSAIHFREGAGTTAGSSITSLPNYNGTFKGAGEPAWLVAGKFYQAVDFDGTNTDYIYFPDAFMGSSLGGNGSIEFWFKPDGGFVGANPSEYIMSKYNSGAVGLLVYLINPTGNLRFRFGVSTYDSTTVVWQDEWYHAVITWGDNGRDVYINGTKELDSGASGKWSVVADDYTTAIGTLWDNSDDSKTGGFDGKIDEFRVYNYSLSDEEVANHYYTGMDMRTSTGTAEVYDGGIDSYFESYSNNIFEAYETSYNVTLTLNASATVVGNLTWNGTSYPVTGFNTTPTLWYFNTTKVHGLIVNNGTAVNFNWNFTLTYPSGTYDDSTVQETQTMRYNPFLDTPTKNVTSPVSGEALRLSSTLTAVTSNVSYYNISGTFNNTQYTTSGTYYFDANAPMVQSDTNINYLFGMTVSYGGRTLYRTSPTSVATITPISLNETSTASNIATLKFQYFKEESPYELMNASHNLAITIWNSDPLANATFNFTLASNDTHTIYMSPVTADVYAFSIQEYWNPTAVDNVTYPVRNYYLNGLHLTNVSQDVKLYLLNSSYADVIGVNVIDKYGDGMSNVIVDAQRYYPGEDLFRTVARGYSDTTGETVMRLFKCSGEASVYHKFLLYKDYSLIGSFEQTCIIDDIITFPITSVNNWWNMYGDVAGGCNFDNTTQLLLCEYTADNTYDAELYVKQIEVIGETQICNTTYSGSSGSLTCNLAGMTDEEYSYSFKVTNDEGIYYIIDSGTLKNLGVGTYQNMGIFIGLLMIIGLSFLGYQNPLVMMMLSVVGILAGFFLGLYEVSYAGIGGLIIASAIIMWGVKSGA